MINRRAFTLVEMLVAMAITLLLMAALARSFGFVGTAIRESRADTTMANSLRDMTTRLSDELSQCTVNLQPDTGGEQDQLGYFVYYEGPLTNATSSLFRAFNDPAGNVQLIDSRYGDFDDYIAFTAVAKGNHWFTGKVPRYILDRKTAEVTGTPYATPAARAVEPVVIRSKYAEIIYFASPEYSQPSLPANPTYVDTDGDVDLNGDGDASNNGLPDRIKIHRRVLLIRPDLNLNSGALPTHLHSNNVNFMLADAWPTALQAPAANATITAAADPTLGWLYGMAGVHQQCDLSLRRVLAADGTPTQNVAANSLADLAKPHNRFAHVRAPNSLLGGAGATPTSMPVLALGAPATIFNMMTITNPALIAPPQTPNAGPVVTPIALSGFLRPEFALGNDLTHIDPPGAPDGWGLERIGEDVLTNNVLGFDVKIYDPEASFFTTYDATPAPTGLVVGPSDAGYRDALTQAINRVAAATTIPPNPPPQIDDVITRTQGGFVDLAYPVLAGGPLRGWQSRRMDRRSGVDTGTIPIDPNASINGDAFLVTPFSGLANYSAAATSQNAYQQWLYNSGRLVTSGNTIRLFQPTFDTFTSYYERDGFMQWTPPGNSGTRWTRPGDTISGWTISQNGATNTTSGAFIPVDKGSDGLDFEPAFGADDRGEFESSPPFIAHPEAIEITIRIENPATRQLRQSTVVHEDR